MKRINCKFYGLGWRKLVLVEISSALYSNAYQYSSKVAHSLQCLFLCLLGMHWFAWAQTPLYTHPLYKFLFSTNDDDNVCVLWRVSSQRRLLIKCGTAECGMRKVKCGMKTAERCCGTVGKMHNSEICRMWAIVCPQEGTVNSYEWAVSYISC